MFQRILSAPGGSGSAIGAVAALGRLLRTAVARGAAAVALAAPAFVLASAGTIALGQASCTPDWLAGDGLPGADRAVFATVAWDPDGPGPKAALLVAGGEFKAIGGAASPGLAAWDGKKWFSLGGGLSVTFPPP